MENGLRTCTLLLALLLSGCQSESENKIEPKKYTVVTLDGNRYTNLARKSFFGNDVFINEEGKKIIFNCPFTVIEE